MDVSKHKESDCNGLTQVYFDQDLARSFDTLLQIQNGANLDDFIQEYPYYTFRNNYNMTNLRRCHFDGTFITPQKEVMNEFFCKFRRWNVDRM